MSFTVAGFKDSLNGVMGSSSGQSFPSGGSGTGGTLKANVTPTHLVGIVWAIPGTTPYLDGSLVVMINGSVISDYVELPGNLTFEYIGTDPIVTTGLTPDSVRIMFMV